MLEEFHLPEAVLGFLFDFVWTAEILPAVFRQNFLAASNLLDHRRTPCNGSGPLWEVDASHARTLRLRLVKCQAGTREPWLVDA